MAIPKYAKQTLMARKTQKKHFRILGTEEINDDTVGG